MYVPMKVAIEGKLQVHASRLCDEVACICVGRSVHVSWVAQYEYTVTRGAGAGYGDELSKGKVFAKVTHDMKHYAIPVEGSESRKLYAEYKVVEHWRVKARDGSFRSNPDCVSFRLPFQEKTRCALYSKVVTTVELEILVAGNPDDKSWESGEGTHYYDDQDGEWDGHPRKSGTPDRDKKTPKGARFEPPMGAGDATKVEKTIEPNPDHCADWGNYLTPVTGGGYRNTKSTYSPKGKYYSHSGAISAKDPEGGGTTDVDSDVRVTRSRTAELLPVGHVPGMRSVLSAGNVMLPTTSLRGPVGRKGVEAVLNNADGRIVRSLGASEDEISSGAPLPGNSGAPIPSVLDQSRSPSSSGGVADRGGHPDHA